MTKQQAETLSKPTLLAAEPQLFVADNAASCEFYRSKLGFSVAFTYGEPPFYGQVFRDGAPRESNSIKRSKPHLGARGRSSCPRISVHRPARSRCAAWRLPGPTRQPPLLWRARQGLPLSSQIGVDVAAWVYPVEEPAAALIPAPPPVRAQLLQH